MILQLHMTQLEKLTKALLYLMVLLCLPDTSGYAGSTQKQAVDHIRTEIILSPAQPAGKTISYQKAATKLEHSTILSADHGLIFARLAWLHDKDFRIAFAHISKECFGYSFLPYSAQPKTIPQGSYDLPPHLSKG